MASRLQRLDVDLQTCYESDLDWTLLPDNLREVSIRLCCLLLSLFTYKGYRYQ